MLGGYASTEHLVPPAGAMQNRLSKEEIDLDPRETGLIEEINLHGKQRHPSATGIDTRWVIELRGVDKT